MTPENVRYHAAGHLAAAALLAQHHPQAARVILREALAYSQAPTVSAPPQLIEKLEGAILDPTKSVPDITLLEAWFVDPMNTVIEKSGGRF